MQSGGKIESFSRQLGVAIFAYGNRAVTGRQFERGQSAETQSSSSAGSFRLNTGVSYSSGEYGELEDTEVIAVPVSLTYKTDGFKFRVSVPWININGPGSLLSTPEGRDTLFSNSGSGSNNSGSGSSNSGSGSSNSGSGSSSSGSGSGGSEVEVEDAVEVVDDDGITNGSGFAGPDNKRSGLGDVTVSALYSLELGSNTWFEPQVKVKLPTASRSKRLGTGEVDVTLSADLVQQLGVATFYIHGRRKFAGKPEGSTIRSTWGAGAGASVSAGNGVYVGADYSWQQSAFVGRQASSEISGWLNTRVSDRVSLTAYVGTGLNDNSADLFGGVSMGFRF